MEQEVIEQTSISANGVSAYVRSGHVSCFPPPQLSDIEDLEATSVQDSTTQHHIKRSSPRLCIPATAGIGAIVSHR
jgi:hypothetical protein